MSSKLEYYIGDNGVRYCRSADTSNRNIGRPANQRTSLTKKRHEEKMTEEPKIFHELVTTMRKMFDTQIIGLRDYLGDETGISHSNQLKFLNMYIQAAILIASDAINVLNKNSESIFNLNQTKWFCELPKYGTVGIQFQLSIFNFYEVTVRELKKVDLSDEEKLDRIKQQIENDLTPHFRYINVRIEQELKLKENHARNSNQ